MKKMLFFTFFFLTIFQIAQGQNASLERFESTFYRNYVPRYLKSVDTCFSTFSLLIADIDSFFRVSNIYFSDQVPDWQKKELEEIKGKLDLNALAQYAKDSMFCGKLIFPFFLKREGKKCSHLLTSIDENSKVFFYKGIPLSGIVRFEKPLVLNIVSVKNKR